MEVKSFVKEVVARLQGDDNEVIAQRNYRKANAAVKGQISSLESKKVDAEVSLEEAKEKLADAKYPTSPIKDNSDYIRTIVRRQEKVTEAEEALEEVNSSLAYFKGLWEEFNPKTAS